MSMPSETARPEGARRLVQSTEEGTTHRSRRPILLRLTLVILGGFAACMATVLAVARAVPFHPVIDPPAYLLPGSPLPENIRCASAFERRFECRASQDGEVVYLTTDNSAQVILHTSITAHHQTIGNVIAAWGAPSSVARFGNALYVYWEQRWAYLFTCRFEPASSIEFFGYGLVSSTAAQQKQLPWRGFTDDGDYACQGGL